METIKIRLDTKAFDNRVYTYVAMDYDTAITYTSGYTYIPDESEIDENSPDYICVSNVISTAITDGGPGVVQTGYFKKESYMTSEYFKLILPVSHSYETNLYQEELVNDLFVNDIKAGVIPDMIDMERVVFTPAYESNGVVYDAAEVVFNFHFSVRDIDNG